MIQERIIFVSRGITVLERRFEIVTSHKYSGKTIKKISSTKIQEEMHPLVHTARSENYLEAGKLNFCGLKLPQREFVVVHRRQSEMKAGNLVY